MRPRVEVKLEFIQKNKEKFILLAQLSKQDLKKIFFQRGDENIDDLDNLVYDWRLPLYCKHIFRFIQGGCQAAGMYWGLDPSGQKMMRSFCGISDENYDGMETMDFFCWIKNSLGMVDILDLEGLIPVKGESDWEDMKNKSKLLESWSQNSITFFLNLDEELQQKLIAKYNVMNMKFKENSSEWMF